ncbi:hypothetical protein OG921_12750 [Aldersonia sp. NBC_00410]|uniref:hypothetical protein n=1 Tax=Aldersonia sp. NBC_00410 TaxID=2975954 RepID=UPI002258A1BE|nr:hypothetical protein [Aldersonia sp. NBC_00410]MCX5044038.1 hypothetical protein [Aldersonia sp. NBC_00410]
MNAAAPSPPRWWRVSMGVALTVLVSVACGVVLWASAAPVVDFVYIVLAGWALLFLGIAWLVLALIGLLRYRAYRASLIAPVLVLTTAALVVFSVPSWIGFQVSKGGLADAAAECRDSVEKVRIGVYEVSRIAHREEGCLFYTQGGLIDSVGVAYLPGGAPYLGRPRHDGEIGYSHLDGDWYRFVEAF